MLYGLPMYLSALRSTSLLTLVTVAATLAVATPAPLARADTPDPEAARLSAGGHSVKWNWTPPGRNERFGHAETLIHASMIDVKRLVLDYARYKELAPSITTSRVVSHWPDGSSDVYLQMGVLNNTISFWNVTRFEPPKTTGNDEVIEGKMVPGKGNIDNSMVIWTLHPAGEGWTVLKFDVLLNPGLPAPQSLIDEQLRDSAMDAVNSIHDRAQGSKDILPYSG
jgi:hypothetical protein